MYTQDQVDAAVAKARNEAYQEAFSAEYAKGTKLEKDRLAAILFGEEAQGREEMAQTLAFDSGHISAETAIGILKTLPRTPKQVLPADRTRNAPGGLLIDSEAELDPKAAFEAGAAIAASLPRQMVR